MCTNYKKCVNRITSGLIIHGPKIYLQISGTVFFQSKLKRSGSLVTRIPSFGPQSLTCTVLLISINRHQTLSLSTSSEEQAGFQPIILMTSLTMKNVIVVSTLHMPSPIRTAHCQNLDLLLHTINIFYPSHSPCQ